MADKDTTNKRRSGLTPLLVLPVADGTIAQADRQHKVVKYAGILATAVVDINVTLGQVGVTGYNPTVESWDELNTGEIGVQGYNPDTAIPTEGDNVWLPSRKRRTWYPTKYARTWKV